MALIAKVRSHARFYAAAALGIVAWVLGRELNGSIRLLVAGNLFFLSHLIFMGLLTIPSAHQTFRRRALRGDDGMIIIALITLTVVAISISAVFALLNHRDPPGPLQMILATGSVPLGWITLHTVFAFHYGHAWFGGEGEGDRPETGIVFPGDAEPRAWDFLYYSFVVGMTAQVSDVSVTSWRMRRLTLGHSVLSFFYNTIILAVTVNAVVVLAP